MNTCGIYGFAFTQPFEAFGLKFEPIYMAPVHAERRARDLQLHHLTGTVSGDELSDPECKYRLEAVLSFIEHLDVRLTDPNDDATVRADPNAAFVTPRDFGQRHNGGGAVINPDWFGPHRTARRDFIDRAMRHASDEVLGEHTRFRLLLIKAAETFRQRRPFLEGSYFLLWSGLEAYCRQDQQDFKSNAAGPISRTLRTHGFDIQADNPQNLARAVATYRDIRNALFHNGELKPTVRLDSLHVTLDSIDYLFHLQMLVCLLIMKVIGFEDEHRNWDCWFDRRPYGSAFDFPDEFLKPIRATHQPECAPDTALPGGSA